MAKRKIKINNFKILRMSKGLSQNDLASIMGVTPRTIQNYETGRIFPPVNIAKKIADEFGKPIEEIFFTL